MAWNEQAWESVVSALDIKETGSAGTGLQRACTCLTSAGKVLGKAWKGLRKASTGYGKGMERTWKGLEKGLESSRKCWPRLGNGLIRLGNGFHTLEKDLEG